jgi:hypothetical protein
MPERLNTLNANQWGAHARGRQLAGLDAARWRLVQGPALCGQVARAGRLESHQGLS